MVRAYSLQRPLLEMNRKKSIARESVSPHDSKRSGVLRENAMMFYVFRSEQMLRHGVSRVMHSGDTQQPRRVCRA